MEQYAGNSYLTPTGRAVNANSMPKPIAKPIRPDGTFTNDIWRYLNGLSSAPAQEQTITLGPSPATFQATANGSILVSGGTVSLIALTRNSQYNLGVTSGYIPMSIGDIVMITYSGAPTCTWFPR
jgi:hypothetical protein